MGIVQHMMEDRDDLYGIAADLLEDVGAIKTCRIHGNRYLTNESRIKNAYKMGNFKITRNVLECDRKVLSDAIKDLAGKLFNVCPSCENVMFDDG